MMSLPTPWRAPRARVDQQTAPSGGSTWRVSGSPPPGPPTGTARGPCPARVPNQPSPPTRNRAATPCSGHPHPPGRFLVRDTLGGQQQHPRLAGHPIRHHTRTRQSHQRPTIRSLTANGGAHMLYSPTLTRNYTHDTPLGSACPLRSAPIAAASPPGRLVSFSRRMNVAGLVELPDSARVVRPAGTSRESPWRRT